jgi:glycosyltransferase involved in cell wall biosynthesis
LRNMAPRVSVIIPAYNVAGYISEALDSTFTQSTGDFEAIVVDDGSPDRAELESVLASCSDPRLRYLQKPNGGLASARNAGIAMARGEWVAFLDGDDAWLPNYLSSQLALLDREPAAAAAFPDGFIFGDTPLVGKRLSAIKEHRQGPVTLEEVVAGRSNLFYCCTVKRAAIERIGGFDESLRRTEDHDLYLRLLLADERILANPEPLFRYRRRGDSLSADRVEMARSALAVLEKLEPQFAQRPGLSRLAEERRNDLRATIEFALGREALHERRWRAAREHWRAHQRLCPSWKVAAALGMSRISPRLMLALLELNTQLRRRASGAALR